jgi:hypothetical protein
MISYLSKWIDRYRDLEPTVSKLKADIVNEIIYWLKEDLELDNIIYASGALLIGCPPGKTEGVEDKVWVYLRKSIKNYQLFVNTINVHIREVVNDKED